MTLFFLVVGSEAKREIDLGSCAGAAGSRSADGGGGRHAGAGRDLPGL